LTLRLKASPAVPSVGATSPSAPSEGPANTRPASISRVPPMPPPAPRDVVGVRPQPLICTSANGASADVVRRAQEAWAKYLGRDVEAEVEVANGVTMTFVLVPPGEFLMGSPTE